MSGTTQNRRRTVESFASCGPCTPCEERHVCEPEGRQHGENAAGLPACGTHRQAAFFNIPEGKSRFCRVVAFLENQLLGYLFDSESFLVPYSPVGAYDFSHLMTRSHHEVIFFATPS